MIVLVFRMSKRRERSGRGGGGGDSGFKKVMSWFEEEGEEGMVVI